GRFQRGQVLLLVQAEIELEPAVVAYRHPLHLRLGAGAGQSDDQAVAGVVGLEAVWLRRASVPGTRGDLEGAVPVAQCQIIEPGQLGAAVGNGVVGLGGFRQAVLHRAVGQADPNRPGGVSMWSNASVRSRTSWRLVSGAGRMASRPSASSSGRAPSAGGMLSGSRRRCSRCQTPSASAGSWLPGSSTQGP